jgi:hypothetical protein
VAFGAPDALFGTGDGDPRAWAPPWFGVATPAAPRARSACPGGLETRAVRGARNAVPAMKTAMAAAANPTPRRARVGGAAGDDGALRVDEDSVRSGGTRYRPTSADAACQGNAGGTLGSPDSWRSSRDTRSPPVDLALLTASLDQSPGPGQYGTGLPQGMRSRPRREDGPPKPMLTLVSEPEDSLRISEGFGVDVVDRARRRGSGPRVGPRRLGARAAELSAQVAGPQHARV